MFFHQASKLSSVSSRPAASHFLLAGTWHHYSLHVSSKKMHPWCISVRRESSQVTKWRWPEQALVVEHRCRAGFIERKGRQVAHVWRSLLVVLVKDDVSKWRGSVCLKVFFWPVPLHIKAKKEKEKNLCVVSHSVQIVKNSLFFFLLMSHRSLYQSFLVYFCALSYYFS